ncbi:transglycosylase SLT domain-containing protein [Streptomyces sp. NPDC002790]|uniref:transglycosylase SLT domain-containing protein n=1 Tax=Streptomyces sp. NPDC002790 TaxID=3154431 RepID=UPI00332EE5AC
MAGSRGAIKVGTGYISIEPHLDRDALARMRTQLTSTMGRYGREFGKALSTGMSRGFEGLTREATSEARKMNRALNQQAKQGASERGKTHKQEAKSFAEVEQEISRTHGKQVAARARQALEASQKRTEGHSKEAKQALRLHQQSVEGMARADRELDTEQRRTAQERARRLLRGYQEDLREYRSTEAAKRRSLEDSARMDREVHQEQLRQERQRRAEQAETLRQQKAALREMARARRADLQNQIEAAQVQRRMLQDQVAEHRRAMSTMTANTEPFFKRFNRGWETSAKKLDTFGTHVTETGRLITHHLIGPLGLLASGLSLVGVKSADSMMQAQTGLHGMGLAVKDVNKLLKEMQQYAIQTPYSLEDMQKYSTRYARALASHNEDFNSKDARRKAKGSKAVSQKAGDIVEMIGDQAAYGGIMDPTMVSQGMYATEVILDMGRTPMRNMKQLERATGIPANELARMYGFKDRMVKDKANPGKMKKQSASAQMYEFMQNAKETGGIEGSDLIDKLLERWETHPGIKGSANRMANATISGRVQQMKENAQVSLGKLFYSEKKDGSFAYTGLGSTIMGKKNEKTGEMEGGLLNELQGMGSELLPMIRELLTEFFQVLTKFVQWIRSTVDFLAARPELRNFVLKVAKMAAMAAPFILGLGLLTKTFGKLGKLLSPALGLARGFVSGLAGAGKVLGQIKAGRQSRQNGGTFRQGYRERRTELRGGDNRSMGRRTWDRFRGQNSRTEEVRIQTGHAEQSLRTLDEKIRGLKQELRGVNNISLDPAMNALGGRAGQSLASAARDASTRIQQATNNMRELNERTTGGVRQQVGLLSQKTETAEHKVKDASAAVKKLNGRGLKALRQEFDWTKPKVTAVRTAVQQVIDRMTKLNGKPLKALRDRFKGGGSSLYSAVNAVAGKLTTVNSRMDSLAKRRVTSTTTSVNNLKRALKGAADEASDLSTSVGEVNAITGLGGGKGKGKHRKPGKHAMGGVLPGYAPGVDNIPAILSPGEAILRPEVAAHLGEGTINTWNAQAARGRLSRFAKGGVAKGKGHGGGKRWPFSILDELTNSINFAPAFNAFSGGIDMASAGSKIGGSTGANVRSWGARTGGDSSGRAANNRFTNMREFMFSRLPDFLKATPTGIGNVIGLAAGAIAPTAGQLFWDDVWKGNGNILQRGAKFTTDLLNPSNLLDMIKDLFSGLADMVKGLGSLAKDLVTNPKKVLDEAIGTFTDLFNGVIDSVKGMIDLVGKIMGNPSEFAREVWDSFYAQAKENLPNTEGLFKFADGGVVPGYSPGNDRVHAMLSPGEAILRPDAVRALGYKTVLGLNQQAKGGKPATAPTAPDQAVTPIPDAEAFEAAAKRIEAALTSMTAAVRSHQSASAGSWADIGAKVAQAVDGQIKPAQGRWINHLGQLTATERNFRSSNQGAWSDVARQVSSSTSNALSSFGRLRNGVDQTKRFFEQASSRIREVWRSAMNFVDSSTRSTVNGPYNKGAVGMISSMAKLAGTSSPLHPVKFNTGGVVPGFLPGVDKVPAVLSPGEGILRPEVVRALGKETILHWNEQARKGGNMFANGGVVGDGASWVRRHKDDPYEGYEEAVHKGWDAAIAPQLKSIASKFGEAGKLNAGAFGKAEPWLAKWGKWADDHTGGGGGQVVKLALQEAKSGDLSGRKYIGSSAYESWCADFVSYVVDHAGANAAYGGSPKGTPKNRWPAVATWVNKMSRVPTGQARAGDLMVYKGYGPGNWGHINIATGKQGKSLETVGGNESRSIRRQLGYGDRADGALRPRGGAPGTGKGPVLNPWPGSLAALSEGVGDYDMPTGSSVNRWRPLVLRVIKELGGKGGLSSKDADLILRRISVESGGNPRAVNNWDSNAKAGHPSKGLMQTILGTFNAYAGPYKSLGQYDPLASIYAGVNYAISRYGSGWRRALSGNKGYWTGTKSATAGLAMVGEQGPELVNFRGGERVYNARRTEEMVAGKRYEIHIHEAKSENTTDAVLRAMRTAEVMAGF